MRDILAERLLARVMKWDPQDLARERPDLQALAAFKYDGYQQFSPGMRFIESLALWLEQFRKDDERKIAYEFVRNRLIFISEIEIKHLVSIAFSHIVLPFLENKVAEEGEIEKWKTAKIFKSPDFKILLRQSAFLALSDGSRIDLFRRSAHFFLSHEQILRTHELSSDRERNMKQNLRNDLRDILGREPNEDEVRFRIVFLLDDFSGSGISYIRPNGDGKSHTGKIVGFYENQCKTRKENSLFNPEDLIVCQILYVATNRAKEYLERAGKELFAEIPFSVKPVYLLPDTTKLSYDNEEDRRILEILPKYYDSAIETESYKKGKHEKPYLGFDECALPLVLGHNTPNNSIPLLWFEENRKIRGLFPRISRF